ncbi:hypothetical protein HF1_01780 [Mycoplasma haemofelis str. Langford 1]|uniref:Uncharacterized protein n=2 Tax=Mycoplasma haemofelis TaxID=29501 RepID=F6FGB5_MYCHI|nr:hypothetical protein [Mycoplasma haemofelis]AEG72505.1 hypothetical protein MHF_0206 [Mycoplasma haemofelis Ohio2]CBY92186.1 hypothetical protein HF1_01780 [Mycoplasma haemofelis str. Langford 1]
MSVLFKSSLGVLGSLGTGTAGAGGLYYGTKVSIDDKVGHDFLGNEEEFNDSWKQKHDQLLEAAEESLIPDLKNIRKTHATKANQDGANALKGWCNSIRDTSYKNIFISENKSLLDLAQKYCIQPIKDKLGTSALVDMSNGQSSFETNYKKLNNYDSSKNGKLDSVLQELKDSFNDGKASENWGKVKEWCTSAIEKPFKGSSDNSFKLVETFCKK